MSLHRSARAPRARAFLPLPVGALVLLVAGWPAGPSAGAAADRYTAGEQAIARVALPQAEAGRLRAAAMGRRAVVATAPVASSRVERVTNRFTASTYDEVTDLDADGRPIALQRFDPSGRLLAAIRFGWSRATSSSILGQAEAGSAGEHLARALGLDPAGQPQVRKAATGDWVVEWPRTVDGVPVRGDGVRVHVWADGTLHLAVRTERPLAPAPSRLIGAADARRLADAHLGAWFAGSSRSGLRVAAPVLAWIAPNDTFNGAAPDAPAPVLRLAWVVEARTSGALAGSLRALRLYIDAGDGRLLGGDVLR